MKLIEKILLPIDVNEDSKEQLNTAIELARLYSSEIIIMYVLPDEDLHDSIKKLVISAVSDSLKKAHESLLEKGVITREPVIEYGNPFDKIFQLAVKENVNLILTGSGRKSKNEKFKLGTTVEKLIRQSAKPIWVVKSDQERKLTNILCPVDFSDPSRRALKNAILLAKKYNTALRILGVHEQVTYSYPKVMDYLEKEKNNILNRFSEEMNQFLKEFDLNGIDHKIDIQEGTAHERILSTIKKYDHDLVIMGANGRSGLNRIFMGSVTEKVTRELPCSFIVTKAKDIIQLRFSSEIKEIEVHFKNANVLVENGFYKEAINEYMICLEINGMHIPSIYKLSEVHRKIGNKPKAEYYDNMVKELLTRLWNKQIEREIRARYWSGYQD